MKCFYVRRGGAWTWVGPVDGRNAVRKSEAAMGQTRVWGGGCTGGRSQQERAKPHRQEVGVAVHIKKTNMKKALFFFGQAANMDN